MKILLIDDDPLSLQGLRHFLAGEGHVVVACEHPGLALAALRSEPFELALSDLKLPDMGGLELLRRLRGLQPGLRTVLTTGLCDEDLLREAAGVGINRVLPKPVRVRDLLEAIAGLDPRSGATATPAPARAGDPNIECPSTRRRIS